ncbi:MAG: hypothetical protein HY075_06845 [Deltaproteobacteria bacterium]|nr:hypothetical protein [Deltaproteobacteria bacterium]
MPSSAISRTDQFFRLEDLARITKSLKLPAPVVKGRVWGGEERNQGWSVECDSFEAFCDSLDGLRERVEFLAFDEMSVDDDTLRIVQDDLYRLAEEESISAEAINKGLAALRSHEKEIYSVVAYAFLQSGRVLFVRAQNELARFVYHPDELLSNEGLQAVRKLKTLVEH